MSQPFKTILAVLIRPWLWWIVVKTAWRHAPRGWWKEMYGLPIPPKDYIEFRMETAFGDKYYKPDAKELIDYLYWCRSIERAKR